MTSLAVCGAIMFGEISTTVALAAVAVLGYLVGLWRRNEPSAHRVERELGHHMRRAIENSRNLETIADGLLLATRDALAQSSRLREAGRTAPAPHVAAPNRSASRA